MGRYTQNYWGQYVTLQTTLLGFQPRYGTLQTTLLGSVWEAANNITRPRYGRLQTTLSGHGMAGYRQHYQGCRRFARTLLTALTFSDDPTNAQVLEHYVCRGTDQLSQFTQIQIFGKPMTELGGISICDRQQDRLKFNPNGKILTIYLVTMNSFHKQHCNVKLRKVLIQIFTRETITHLARYTE